MTLKKFIALCLCGAMASCALSGCAKKQTLPDEINANEIISMQALDSAKMTVTIRAEYNVNNAAIIAALKKKFPEVNFVSVFHCTQETQYELRQSLLGNNAEDIVISPSMKSVSDIAPKCLLDLSSGKFTGNYIGSALDSCALDGKLYYLPGPSSMYGIVYDKTMFAQHGWQVPHSYDEFVSLVKAINATGIRAIQPSCKYARQAQMVLTMFAYDNAFDGVENNQWIKKYQSGTSSMTGHIESALSRYVALRDAGILKSSDFDMQPGNRSDMLYKYHTCAMIIENEQAERYAQQYKSDHQYGMMPFWCDNGKTSDHLMSTPNYYLGVSARLVESKYAAKLKKVNEILAYISTPAGQLAINGGTMTQISNVKGTPYTKSEFNADIQDTINKGNLVPEVELMASGNNNAAEKALQTDLRKLLDGKIQTSGLAADCDAARDKALSSPLDRGKKIGQAGTDFTVLQTGLFIADALKEKAGADIGLCLVGTTRCGMTSRIFKGDLYTADISSLSLSVGKTSGKANDQKLWLVSMTGSELTKLIKQAYQADFDEEVPDIPYYVASGLKIEFAPWAKDKLVSVKLAGGGALESSKTYTVALWGWPFDSDCPGTVEKVFSDTSDSIIASAVSSAGTLMPINDGRFTLNYSAR